MSLVARYRSPTVFEFVDELCFDLSEGGMFIKSKVPAPSGTLLKIECQVNEGPEQISAVARVVWVRENDSDEGPRGMGVKFVKLENGSSDVIARVLTRASHSLPPSAPSTPPAAPSIAPAAPSAAPETTEAKPPEPATSAAPQASAKPAASGAAAKKPEPAASPAPVVSRPAPAPAGVPTIAWVLGGLVLMALVVIASRRETTEAPAAPNKPAAAAAAPTSPTPSAPPEQARPTPQPAPSVDAPQTAPSVDAPVAEPPAVVPAVEAPAPVAAPTTEPAPPVAAAAPVAPSPAPAAASPAATAVVAGALEHTISVVTTPKGATVSTGTQTCTAPCTLRLGALSAPIKITATKARHVATAATLGPDTPGFEEREGVLHKTVYLRLQAEAAAEAPAAQAPSE